MEQARGRRCNFHTRPSNIYKAILMYHWILIHSSFFSKILNTPCLIDTFFSSTTFSFFQLFWLDYLKFHVRNFIYWILNFLLPNCARLPWISILRETWLRPIGGPPRPHWMRTSGWLACLCWWTLGRASLAAFPSDSRTRFIHTWIVIVWQLSFAKILNQLLQILNQKKKRKMG